MAIKRKRSSSSLTTSPSASSTTSSSSSSSSISPLAQSSFATPIFWGQPCARRTLFPSPPQEEQHISGRTMKRVRDNRPREEEIHQRTLQMLFSAQQQHHISPEMDIMAEEQVMEEEEEEQQPMRAQGSLHRFWKISSAPKAPARYAPTTRAEASTCEDCGAGEQMGEDVMMDVDESNIVGCAACGKGVCAGCSVGGVSLGSRRRCLGCAGSR